MFFFCPVRATAFFRARRDVRVLLGFNFFDVWNY